jgi:glycosyltransferase involved in cell wall biosynthesis
MGAIVVTPAADLRRPAAGAGTPPDATTGATTEAAADTIMPGGGRRPKLIFLVTEDWYFWSHRLPAARAARDAGFDVVVATRVRKHGERIRAEGFRLAALPWRRRGDGIVGAGRAIAAIAALYRRERPDIVHHVALKPVLFGSLAVRLAFRGSALRPAAIAAVAGLGSGMTSPNGLARFARPALDWALRSALGWAVRRAAAGGRVIVQNPEDGAVLTRLGIDRARIVLIRGSGVDIAHFTALPEPPGPPDGTVTVALVARMLRSKGVIEAVAAVRRLRAEGVAIALLLAGPTDPDNGDSLDAPTLAALAAEPGVEWLGHVADVRTVWHRAAVAVFPSTYGEGVPKALLEAAACGRPIVATDMPGCREVVRPPEIGRSPGDETGLLVAPHDIAALAAALATLARDPDRRRAMGQAGRALALREFGERQVADETLAVYRAALRERDSVRRIAREIDGATAREIAGEIDG